MFTCLLRRLCCFRSLSTLSLSEGTDSVGGQTRGHKECLFIGVTNYGTAWRKGDGKLGLGSAQAHSASSEEEEPEIKEAASVRHASYKELTVFSSWTRAQELCESRGERPGLPVPNKPTVSVDVKQHSTSQEDHRSCVQVEVVVLGSPSLISLMVSVDAKQQ